MRVGLACAAGLALASVSCARPFLARDGTLVFQEKGAHGASIVTANGIEFHDVADVPDRVVVRDPYEPWRAPLGFILPADGRFTKTSVPTLVATQGLGVSLRPSDTRVPSWGGEMLVRVDVLAPAPEGAARWGEDVAIVLDGRGDDLGALAAAAVEQLGGRDRVEVLDAAGPASVVVPAMPASHRSLVDAAIERTLASSGASSGAASSHSSGASSVAERAEPVKALQTAIDGLASTGHRRILVLGDAKGRPASAWAEALGDAAVPMTVVSAGAGDLETRLQAVRDFVPPSGATEFRNVVLSFDATPAPSHVLEASGGDTRWDIEGGELALGDVRAGEERAEVVRVTIPAWTPGESFTLHVSARFEDLAHDGASRSMAAELHCTYDDNVERLAASRHGDVIAYASALATLSRLDAAFAGGGTGEGLRAVAEMHARSLALLARDMHDPAAAEQAALLEALLAAVPR
jgi:hypothetical protein